MSNKKTMIVALALFALVVATVPAGARPPEGKGKPGPTDDTALGGGTMCDPAGYPLDETGEKLVGVQTNDFTFTLGGKQDGTCIDVISIEGPWKVTIAGDGARYLGVIPRDSIGPGDSCGGWLLRSTIYDYGKGTPLILGYNGIVPAATVNACGTDFAEWVDIELEGLTPDKDCVVLDEGLCLVGAELPTVPHPLVLQVFLRGSANGTTTFEVDLPPIGE